MSDRELTSLELVEAFERYPGIVPTWPRLIRERALAEAAPPPLDGLRAALEAISALTLGGERSEAIVTSVGDIARAALRDEGETR